MKIFKSFDFKESAPFFLLETILLSKANYYFIAKHNFSDINPDLQ